MGGWVQACSTLVLQQCERWESRGAPSSQGCGDKLSSSSLPGLCFVQALQAPHAGLAQFSTASQLAMASRRMWQEAGKKRRVASVGLLVLLHQVAGHAYGSQCLLVFDPWKAGRCGPSTACWLLATMHACAMALLLAASCCHVCFGNLPAEVANNFDCYRADIASGRLQGHCFLQRLS